MKYNDSPFMYTEAQMQKRINKLKPSLWISKGVDILVTHAPAEGYGDLDDLPHTGYACFNELLDKYKPAYMRHYMDMYTKSMDSFKENLYTKVAQRLSTVTKRRSSK